MVEVKIKINKISEKAVCQDLVSVTVLWRHVWPKSIFLIYYFFQN
jgi:hypothetical protein